MALRVWTADGCTGRAARSPDWREPLAAGSFYASPPITLTAAGRGFFRQRSAVEPGRSTVGPLLLSRNHEPGSGPLGQPLHHLHVGGGRPPSQRLAETPSAILTQVGQRRATPWAVL